VSLVEKPPVCIGRFLDQPSSNGTGGSGPRVGVGLDPVDVTDADDARWLRACLPPDQSERAARLDAEVAPAIPSLGGAAGRLEPHAHG
jgi:Uncharacterized protein conserved in bacteria (DUF2332)